MMIITMLLNGMLKCIENSSLGSRSFIFLHSKIKGTTGIPIVLQEKVGVLKNKNTSYEILRQHT